MSTKIADVIVPEIFDQYVQEKTAEKSNILNSGIAMANPKLDELVNAGGVTFNMPYWKDLSGDDEVLSDSNPLSVGKITAEKDIACLLLRGKAWGANELAGALAGSDPMAAIGDRVADYWSRMEQKILVSVLTGVFASTKMAADHVSDISGNSGDAAKISGNAVLDAKQLLGDSAENLQAIMMHSAVYTALQKANMIQYTSTIGPSGSPITIATYLTYAVVVDDGMPYDSSTGVYTTYLFARGAIGRGSGNPVDFTATETDRDSLQGEDILIHRRALVLHPMGIKWIGNAAGVTPTNAELATGTNWERVYESKNVGMVALKHKI